MEIVKDCMDLVKNSIKELQGYVPNNVECNIKLDANEGRCKAYKDIYKNIGSEFNVNLYPDDEAKGLRYRIKDYVDVELSNIVVGNGSSELVELIIKTFVDKDETVLSFVPTFSMYEVYTTVNGGKFVGVKCREDFSVNVEKIIQKANEVKPKVIFLCNPNNPTGYLIRKKDIIRIIESTDCIVVCDEAYIEFANNQESMINEISNFDRLIVLKTFSKAFSLAALRVGYMVSNEKIASIINTVRPPYNLNTMSQLIATKSLENIEPMLDYVEVVKKEREFLIKELKNLNIKVYESKSNFIYFKCDTNELSQELIDRDILIRSFGDYYRVTVGEKQENKAFIKAVRDIVEREEI